MKSTISSAQSVKRLSYRALVRAPNRVLWHGIAATLMLLCSGFAVRALENSLRRPAGSAEAGVQLASLPLELGAWRGSELALSELIIQASDADRSLCRQYVNNAARAAVTLYVADGVRTRDLLPHRPDVCYPAAGWTLQTTAPVWVQLESVGLTATRYRFGRGGFDGRVVTVLSFFIVDGKVVSDTSSLRGSIWEGPRRMQQVQITCVQEEVICDRCAEVVCEFARCAGGGLLKVLGADQYGNK